MDSGIWSLFDAAIEKCDTREKPLSEHVVARIVFTDTRREDPGAKKWSMSDYGRSA